jgi:hypothetical protein
MHEKAPSKDREGAGAGEATEGGWTMIETKRETFEGWAILEIMGHRRLAGWLTEQEIAGHGFLRIDVPVGGGEEGDVASQFYSPSSVYAITPCSEEIARELSKLTLKPVQPWDLRALLPTPDAHPKRSVFDDDDDEQF